MTPQHTVADECRIASAEMEAIAFGGSDTDPSYARNIARMLREHVAAQLNDLEWDFVNLLHRVCVRHADVCELTPPKTQKGLGNYILKQCDLIDSIQTDYERWEELFQFFNILEDELLRSRFFKIKRS
jgi:hypothetical protein